ncbi:hypothetical protein ABPG73_022159 [Tetrahymena malaccensis]
MNIFRSENMGYYHLILPRESSWEVMNELGGLSLLHFIDQNPDLPNINKAFTNYIKRCDEVLFKLNLIKKQMHNFDKEINKPDNFKDLQGYFNKILQQREKAGQTYFEEIEDSVYQKATQLEEQINNYTNLQDKQDHLVEYKDVLIKAKTILGPSFFKNQQEIDEEASIQSAQESVSGLQQIDINQSQLSLAMRDMNLPVQKHHGLNVESNLKLNYVVGTVSDNDAAKFQKIIFRITKGNSWVIMQNLEQKQQNEVQANVMPQKIGRSVFLMLIPGQQAGFINQKIQRICDSFGVNKYQFPETPDKYEKRLQDLDNQIRDSRHLLKLTQREINDFLETFSQNRNDCKCSYIEELIYYIEKEKLLYTNLNYLKAQSTHYHGNCWLPKDEEESVLKALQNIRLRYPHLPNGQLQEVIPAAGVPPTYFKLNDFTRVFQVIVNTYGVPRYKEVNPGLFTIVTFPFLFGVMFGDIGHGFLLFVIGCYLCLWKEKIESDASSMFKLMLPARYIIIMMGFFAVFCGLIYNEFFSIVFNIFGSCYDLQQVNGTETITKRSDCVYDFGFDPIWVLASNNLTFQNSFKMKFAVIIAIIHMSLGICMKAFNAIFFKSKSDFYFEFLPQIIFLLLTFGYMDFLIIIKWVQDWTTHILEQNPPPSIITLMINIPLKGADPAGATLYGPSDAGLQKSIGIIFLLIAIVCVPLMLLPKPFIQHFINKKKHQALNGDMDDHNQDKKYLIREEHKSEISPRHDSQGQNNLQEIPLDDLQKDLEQYQKNIEIHHNVNNEQISDDHHIEVNEHEGFSDLFVHQVIETIEFVLGSISNTASYLRLWALSLAHGQLARVFFQKALQPFIEMDGGVQIIALIIGYYVFALVTFGVLMCMDVMECFLHALRLHWVEFQNKFYKADGYAFVPYSIEKHFNELSQTKDI